jgi:hypothetical protein
LDAATAIGDSPHQLTEEAIARADDLGADMQAPGEQGFSQRSAVSPQHEHAVALLAGESGCHALKGNYEVLAFERHAGALLTGG